MPEHQLEFVDPVADDHHLNVFLYGPPKTGKTMGGASAPGPILYLNGDRPNAVVMAKRKYGDKLHIAKITGLETMIAATHALLEEHDYETVVIDPISELHRMTLEGLSGRSTHPPIQLYLDAQTHIERFCRHLCDLPINVVFIAWEKAEKDEESGTFERVPFMGTNNSTPAAKLMAMVDVIGYTGVVAGDGDEPPKYMAQLVPAGGRKGGDRFGVLGRTREVDLTEWVQLTSGN